MKRLFIIILLASINWVIFAQTDTTLVSIKPKEIKLKTDSIKQFIIKPDNFYNVVLVGALIDPIIFNELGIGLIGSSKSPNVGLSIDFSPLFLRRTLTQIEFRSDFNKNMIFKGMLETRYLTGNLDFKILYENYSIQNSTLSEFNRISIGTIYRRHLSNIGFLLGQDSFEKKIGFDIFFNHTFYFRNTNDKLEFKKNIIGNGTIGLWNNEINYQLGMTYLINFKYSCGIEYRKLYDLNEILLTLRYIFHCL